MDNNTWFEIFIAQFSRWPPQPQPFGVDKLLTLMFVIVRCLIINRDNFAGLGRLHPYGAGSGSGSSSDSGRRRARTRGLSDSPTAPTTPTSASDIASDATLTDSELPLARDSTLLVQNGMVHNYIQIYKKYRIMCLSVYSWQQSMW